MNKHELLNWLLNEMRRSAAWIDRQLRENDVPSQKNIEQIDISAHAIVANILEYKEIVK